MRKPHQLLFLLLGALFFASPMIALADEVLMGDQDGVTHRLQTLRTAGAKLRTNLSNDPDTIWIGHIASPTYVPVDRNRNPVPSSARTASGFPSVAGTVPVGGFGPWHVGRGDYLPGIGVRNTAVVPNGQPPSYDGVWDFDHFQAGDDTLQGWWPIARPGQTEGAGNTNDKVRSFFGLDYGNQGNYTIDQGSPKRTLGVVGYWHRDPGNGATAFVDTGAVIPGPNPEWAPLGGLNSAWCGLRADHDLSAQDLVSNGGTGNYFNQNVISLNGNNAFNQIGSHAANGTDKNFPGYGSQWDQMMYRDVVLGATDDLNISFKYMHALSPDAGGTALQRIGYFWKDPIRPTSLTGGGVANDGNFISRTETDGAAVPAATDSFMVFVGVPEEPVANPFPTGIPNDFVASDGVARDIYDPQRRWFSEVIKVNGPMIELLSRCGWSKADGTSQLPQTSPPLSATFTKLLVNGTAVNGTSLANIISAGNGKVRLVFRVKTNRGTDDEDYVNSSFTSFTRGAAIIDDVSGLINNTGSNVITNGDFEAANSIDNTLNMIEPVSVTNGSFLLTSVALFGAVSIGDYVYGNNIPAGTTVVSTSPSSVTISLAAVNSSSTARVWFTTNSAVEAWKSTGKPPHLYIHVHSLDAGLIWNDPCSPPDFSAPSAPNRNCNMIHNVLAGGDHDNSEKPAGVFGGNEHDQQKWAVSPVIILATDPDPTKYNAMGLNSDIMANFTDWTFWNDIHTAGFLGTGATANGGARSVGLQSYPSRQLNGALCWGEQRTSTSVFFANAATCAGGAGNAFSLYAAGFMATSNLSGIPDSIRVYLQMFDRCYAANIDAAHCSPASGTSAGQYMDNLVFEIERGSPVAGLTNSPWMNLVDAFPQYVSSVSPLTMKTNFTSAQFDTSTAVIKAAINRALPGGASRISVVGDSAQVTTGAAPSLRVDMVFRIFPGPGNYVQIGNKASGLRKVPTSTTKTANVPSTLSLNFWESYMADNGAHGTGDTGGVGPGHPVVAGAAVWDVNLWNSARLDTLEQNLWPNLAAGSNVATNSGGSDWQSTYNELDPKYITLGVAKNRCFMVLPTGGQACSSKTPNTTAQCNIICGTVPSAGSFVGTYPPTWTTTAGLVSEVDHDGFTPMPKGVTFEDTKVIPDGQLTPGSEVQYFYRREPGTAATVDLYPDTTQIFSAQADGNRWYHMSVLPDRWKDSAWGTGGAGMACMLVVDNQDRGGDEFFWVSAADSIGLTSLAKRGAQTGWYALGGVNTPGLFDLAVLRRDNGGQPGTLWDKYDVRAGESITTGAGWLSNRYAAQPVAGQLVEGRQSTTGAWDDVLKDSGVGYKSMVWLVGSVTNTFFGPVVERTDNDFQMMTNYATLGGARAVFVWGAGFGEDLTSVGAAGVTFMNTYFGASLKNKAYRTYSGFNPQVAHAFANPGGAFDLASNRQGIDFGLSNGCGLESDVLDVYTPVTGAVANTFYENVGTLGPYIGSVYAPATVTPPRLQTTLWDGSRDQRVGSFAAVNPLGRQGFQYFMIKALAITSGALSCGPYASPVGVGDGPHTGPGSAFVNFLNLKSSNPMHSKEARMAFGLAKTEKVELRVYDVTGRVVKTVANRIFAGGQEHTVTWDGTDEAGNKVRSGVYFYQLRTATWTSQKKLAVLSN